MKNKIFCETTDIDSLFSDAYSFYVPAFQRAYAWTEREAGQLYRDLYAGYKASRLQNNSGLIYFLGGIVLIKEEGRPLAQIVDGQQRLITLTILLAVLRDTCGEEMAEALQKRIYELRAAVGKARLEPSKDDRGVLEAFIQRMGATKLDASSLIEDEGTVLQLDDAADCSLSRDDGDETEVEIDGYEPAPESHQNILHNREFFKRQVAELTRTEREALATYILKNCQMIMIAVPDVSDAYRVFSVLHSTGLPLSFVDVLKAQVIGNIEVSHRDIYADKWNRSQALLTRDNFEELFKQIYALEAPEDSGPDALTAHMLAQAQAMGPKVFIDEMLTPQARLFSELQSGVVTQTEQAEQINRLLLYLNCLEEKDWLAVGFLWLRHPQRRQDHDLRFFKALERYYFCNSIVSGADTTRLQQHNQALSGLRENIESYDKILAFPEQRLHKLVLQKLLSNGRKNPFYIKSLLQRFNIDSALQLGISTKLNMQKVNLEHVLPVGGNHVAYWSNRFKVTATIKGKRKSVYKGRSWLHMLGNLILLEIDKNFEAANNDFDFKRQIFIKSEVAMAKEAASEADWTRKLIQSRTSKMVDKLSIDWKF